MDINLLISHAKEADKLPIITVPADPQGRYPASQGDVVSLKLYNTGFHMGATRHEENASWNLVVDLGGKEFAINPRSIKLAKFGNVEGGLVITEDNHLCRPAISSEGKHYDLIKLVEQGITTFEVLRTQIC